MYIWFNNNGLPQISIEKETFYLAGLPRLNRDGIKMKFSVQSIMEKLCEPDSLASGARRPGTQSDRSLGIQPLWVSQLKGRAESPPHSPIFMTSPLALLLTHIRLTSII